MNKQINYLKLKWFRGFFQFLNTCRIIRFGLNCEIDVSIKGGVINWAYKGIITDLRHESVHSKAPNIKHSASVGLTWLPLVSLFHLLQPFIKESHVICQFILSIIVSSLLFWAIRRSYAHQFLSVICHFGCLCS